MDIDEDFLIPTSHRIIVVTGKNVDIKGVLLLEINYKEKTSQNVVYVCKNVKGFFLSTKTQKELGILPLGYPTHVVSKASSATSQEPSCKFPRKPKPGKPSNCDCPQRESPPKRPDKIPFPPTEANRSKLAHSMSVNTSQD